MEKNSESFIEKNKKLFDFLQKNYGWFIAVFTGIGFIILNIFKFIEYVTANIYFSHYGLDINLYKYGDMNVFYELAFSLIIMISMWSIFFCMNEIMKNIKEKHLDIKKLISDIAIICFNSIWVMAFINADFNWENFLTVFIAEIICALFFYKSNNNDNSINMKQDFLTYMKKLPTIVIILIILFAVQVVIKINNLSGFRTIDDNKVIVYSNNEYYLTLDCEVKESEIIIHKGTQNKMPNDNISSKYKKYENVKIK